MNKAIFIDKDGTLVEDVPYNVNPDFVQFTDGVIEGLRKLKNQGYLLIVVSNQSGIAHGYFDEDALENLKRKLQEMLELCGVQLDAIFFCPHHPRGIITQYACFCECRKPKPGMLLQAAKNYDIDLSHSWMIGDILNDIEAGNTAGCRTILINNGNETEWRVSEQRKPTAVASDFMEAALIIIHQCELV